MNRNLQLSLLVLIIQSLAVTAKPIHYTDWRPTGILTDTTAPVIFCPPSLFINLAPLRCDTVIHYVVTAFDDQGPAIVILSDGIASDQPFPIGITICRYIATDLAGNTATCSFSISVLEPNSQPQCRDTTVVSLNANCTKNLKAMEVLIGGPYGCPLNYITEVDTTLPFGNGPWLTANFTAASINKTYQARVTALQTNAKCLGMIRIRDATPPVLQCQNISVPCVVPEEHLTPAFLHDSLGIGAAQPTALDACTGPVGGLTFDDSFVNLTCGDTASLSGVVKRTWSATDIYGNTGTCLQTIQRKRNLADVQIPLNRTQDCVNPDLSVAGNGRPFVMFGGRKYELTDNTYCEFNWSYSDTLLQGLCAGQQTMKRSWIIHDACAQIGPNNPKTGIQVIEVTDHSGPQMQCPPDQTVNVQEVNCRASVDFPDFTLSDVCSGLAQVQATWLDGAQNHSHDGTITPPQDSTQTASTGVFGAVANFPVGTTVLRYFAADDCGNSSTCSFRLTVADQHPPVALCDSLLKVSLLPSGYLSIPATVLDNGSSDNCTALAFRAKLSAATDCFPDATILTDTLKVCCHDSGDTLHGTLRVYDITAPPGQISDSYGAGHYSECNFKIKVSGMNPPTCIASPNITVSCEQFDPTLQDYGGLLSQSCSVVNVESGVNYSQFDTMCNRGTITRIYQVFAANGQMGQCTQKITVNYNQEYYIHFPDDVIVTTCDSTGIYGAPQIWGEDCELMSITHTDQTFTVIPDACFKIERTWSIINWCTFDPGMPLINVPNPTPNPIANSDENLPGPIVSPIQTPGDPWKSTIVKINPTDAQPTNYSLYYNQAANGYTYKQVIKFNDSKGPNILNCYGTDGQTINDLSNNDPQFWNAQYWVDPVLVSTDLCEAGSDINVMASDDCTGSNLDIQYQLYLDLNGDGVLETVVNSANLPPANIVYYNNSTGPGEARQFDFRPVSADQKYRFAKKDIVNGNVRTVSVMFNTLAAPNDYVLPQLPYGRHKIRWIVRDNCGNQSVCEYFITIRDGKPPIVVCQNGLTANILPTGMYNFQASDILQYDQDNCTPANLLILGLRKYGTGTGFPLDNLGNPVEDVSYDCDEVGTNVLELWCKDRHGNVEHCSTEVLIQDNANNCSTSQINYEGHIKTETNDGIEGVQITLDGVGTFTPPVGFFPDPTDSTGYYRLYGVPGVPAGQDVWMQPVYDADPLNGVTTYDLVLISKHILGIQALGSPYKMIAADANKSNSITTFDIVEIRKLILGIYHELPNTTSWRFIKKSYVFPNPQMPFQPGFPEIIYLSEFYNNPSAGDFVGVKIGDVNNTVVANATAKADDRQLETATFNVSTDQEALAAGDETVVHFSAEKALDGFQFTLNLNELEVLEILPSKNTSRDQFALFPGKDALTVACETGGISDFSLRCRARAQGNLREMLSISSRITKAEAYPVKEGHFEAPNKAIPVLRFPALQTFELYQNHPNPFSSFTDITFNLPESSTATLKVTDLNGKVIYMQTGNFEAGVNTISIDHTALDATGILYYSLETPAYSAVRKMMKL